MELVKGGSLESFMEYRKLKKLTITDSEASIIMKQILQGIQYFHDFNIIHRDLKPPNILMKSFRILEGSVKIADFGLGTKFSDLGSFGETEKCGTILYAAPELIHKTYYRKV